MTARNFEHMNRKVELIGASTSIQIWVDDKLYMMGINGVKKAAFAAKRYIERHAPKVVANGT